MMTAIYTVIGIIIMTPHVYAVAEWYGAGLAGREVAGSNPTNGCCVPTPTQRAIPPGSVNEYQR